MNNRFSEYTTSGAFTLSLTRNQVSTLSMLDGGLQSSYCSPQLAALERKGLVETVADPSQEDEERTEFRATYAGLLTAGLLREASLTNTAPDPVAAELSDLRAQLERARFQAASAQRTARSALARKAELEWELENARRRAADEKPCIRIIPRDPIPQATDAELWASTGADA